MRQHIPVMLEEAISYLDVRPGGLYVDCTCGMAGHSEAILERLGEGGHLIARDADPESLAIARERLARFGPRVTFEVGTFSQLEVPWPVDGLLADLGLSMVQLLTPERGFSFDADSELDMRLNRSIDTPNAGDIVNRSSEQDIAGILETLGEERRGRARRIARAILRARPVSTAKSLATIVDRAVPWEGRLRPCTRTFQALRMATTGELEEVTELVKRIPNVVAPGGRAVVISFESLTDRVVKRGFQEMARGGRAEILTRHVARPGDEEVRRNPASRSAKLRAVRMVAEADSSRAGDTE
ncbi:MAG: 16S rRNA (cytosine(1402)-N(4))-methyltransferase RsmH [Bryobacteraceae bacterium]